MNHVESLIAEWYRYQKYLVCANVRTRKGKRGGWQRELDVLAYRPKDRLLVHIEANPSADTWAVRKQRLGKKFDLKHEEYEELINASIGRIKKIAVIGWSEKPYGQRLGEEIEIISTKHLLREIARELSKLDFDHSAIPETMPLLRTVQLTMRLCMAKRTVND